MRAYLIAGLLLAVALSAGAQENLLQNPGFENGSSHGWYSWETLKLSRVVKSPEGAHSEAHSLQMELDPDKRIGGFVQNLWGLLKWGDPIHASVWIRTEDLHEQHAFLKVDFFDIDWVAYGSLESRHVTGSTDWTEVYVTGSVPTRAEAPDLDKIHVVLCISSKKTSGHAYFDDAYAGKGPRQPAPAPAPGDGAERVSVPGPAGQRTAPEP